MLKERTLISNLIPSGSLQQRKKTKPGTEFSKEKLAQDDRSSITIKFVGDLKQNILDIVSSLQCSEHCKSQISHILSLYANKINKLREERDFYHQLVAMNEETNRKNTVKLKQRIQQLEVELDRKQKQQCLCQRCTCFDSDTPIFTEQYSDINKQSFAYAEASSIANQKSQSQSQSQSQLQLQSKKYIISCQDLSISEQKISSQGEESILIENDENSEIVPQSQSSHIDSNISLQSELSEKGEEFTEEQLMKLMLKYNFSLQELQQILQEYEVEHMVALDLFDSEQQRNLYKLGQKMQKTLWKKKVMHDVKRLSKIKNQHAQPDQSKKPAS